jgi:hypothetical protein
MEQREFDAEFFAVPDGTVTVIIHDSNELPEALKAMRKSERRPPRKVYGDLRDWSNNANDVA